MGKTFTTMAAVAARASLRRLPRTSSRRSVAAIVGLTGLLIAAGQSTTASASEGKLTYEETREGLGDVVQSGDLVSAHYVGTLANGKEFDSSRKRGRPLTFRVGKGEVIQGWDKGIVGDPDMDVPPMKVGGLRVLNIPSSLGYGARGAGGVIPPNADLVFEVEIMSVKKGDGEEF